MVQLVRFPIFYKQMIIIPVVRNTYAHNAPNSGTMTWEFSVPEIVVHASTAPQFIYFR